MTPQWACALSVSVTWPGHGHVTSCGGFSARSAWGSASTAARERALGVGEEDLKEERGGMGGV